jgi:formate dehydrogenase subunit delta
MSVDREKLLHMAQQIAANLDYGDEQAVIAANVASHLQRFWDPRMRVTILAHLEEQPEAFSPVLQQALELLTEATA